MQSAKNRIKVLSALSMAAAATFAVKSAHAANLTLYYGQTTGTSAATSDGVYIGTELGSGSTSRGGVSLGGVAPTSLVLSQTGPADTIVLPAGDYLSLSINAVLTGNPNSDGGLAETTNSSKTVVQTNNLGLSALGIKIGSSDTSGAVLQPQTSSSTPNATFNSVPGYLSTAKLNQSQTEPGGPVAPTWTGSTSPGDVELNSGSVGSNSQIFGGNTSANGLTGNTLAAAFSSSAATAAYGNSTEFFNSLIYKASATPGTVTLTPYADTSATEYWRVITPATGGGTVASGGTLTQYQPTYFGAGDTVNPLPLLVIDVTATTVSLGHAIVDLASSAPTPTYGSSSGTLTVTGNHGQYTLAQITGLSDVTNYVEATGWNPSTDEEIYALDVLVNGQQATGAQLTTLINAIDGDGKATASAGVVASTTPDVGGFPSNYNLFLTYAAGVSNPDFLGVDLSSSNDSNLAGYTFSAVATVPEPMSLGLLAAGGVGLLARRNRRKA